MAITKERKDELVAQYVDLLEQSTGFVVIQYGGMSVPQIDKLRNAVREAEGYYAVTKNTLFAKALEQLEQDVPTELMQGPTAVAFGLSNFPGVAKAVLDYLKDDKARGEKIKVLGGKMANEMVDAAGIETISKLPTLDELRAQLAGLVVSPAQGIVSVIQAANSQIVNVLQAYLDDRGEGGEDAA